MIKALKFMKLGLHPRGVIRSFVFLFIAVVFIAVVFIFFLGIGLGWYISKNPIQTQTAYQKNSPQAFYSEVYDKIKENYWESLSDEVLVQAFKDASSAQGKPISVDIKTKEEIIKNLDKQEPEKIIAQVLASLKPIGRSGLFTTKQQEALKNTVNNVNPDKDLYKDLGLSKGASEAAITDAFEKLPDEKKKDEKIAYAKDVLTKEETKKRYDGGGVEPTIFTQTFPNTLYLQFTKFSPTSLEEIVQAFKANENGQHDSVILDLRGNVGGAIDATAYLIGYFIGAGQLAFDFYRKDDFLPIRAPTDKIASISKYKNMVILVDNQTQSSAELLASFFKKYNLGVVVGTPTKGWGTVEKVFELENQVNPAEKFSMFLVHSITLRDDNQPIEGRGVEPDIKLSDPDWETQINAVFRNSGILSALKAVI